MTTEQSAKTAYGELEKLSKELNGYENSKYQRFVVVPVFDLSQEESIIKKVKELNFTKFRGFTIEHPPEETPSFVRGWRKE